MRWRALLLCEETMLHPTAELLRRAAELHGIRRVRTLHHHALEEIAAERAVRNRPPHSPAPPDARPVSGAAR